MAPGTTTSELLINGTQALEKLGLLHHPTVLLATQHQISFDIVEKSGEGVQVLSWYSALTKKNICELTIEARTFMGAAGENELNFLKEAVLFAAKQAVSCLQGEVEFPETTIGKAFSQSHVNAAEHNEKAKVIDNDFGYETMADESSTIKGKEYIMPEIFPKEKMATEDTVKLIDASALYQPVQGTGHGSRYFVMAIGDDMKLAVRIKGTTLSVRIEGEYLKKMNSMLTLEALGISYGKGSTYASMHVECGDILTAQKTVGSILGALANHTEWQTPMPTVALINGIGM